LRIVTFLKKNWEVFSQSTPKKKQDQTIVSTRQLLATAAWSTATPPARRSSLRLAARVPSSFLPTTLERRRMASSLSTMLTD
jgi:hypothetical protein